VPVALLSEWSRIGDYKSDFECYSNGLLALLVLAAVTWVGHRVACRSFLQNETEAPGLLQIFHCEKDSIT